MYIRLGRNEAAVFGLFLQLLALFPATRGSALESPKRVNSPEEVQFINQVQNHLSDNRIRVNVEICENQAAEEAMHRYIPYFFQALEDGNSLFCIHPTLVGKVDPIALADRQVRLRQLLVERRDDVVSRRNKVLMGNKKLRALEYQVNTMKLASRIGTAVIDREKLFKMQAELENEMVTALDTNLKEEVESIIAREPKQRELEVTVQSIAASAAETIRKRARASLEEFSFKMMAGNIQRNPMPNSFDGFTGAAISARLLPLTMLLGEKSSMANRLFFDVNAYQYNFGDNDTRNGTMLTLGLKDKDSIFELYGRKRIESFAEGPVNPEYNPDSYDRATVPFTAGFKWKAQDRSESDSFAYVDYETFKFSDAPFEANVIKETAKKHPYWPMAKLLNPNPGLLLGYLMSIGFEAEIYRLHPEIFPLIVRAFGKIELRGSAMGADDPDGVFVYTGVKFKLFDKIILGFMVGYGTDLSSTRSTFQNGKSISHALVFIEIPYERDPVKYKEKQFANTGKVELKELTLFQRMYSNRVPFYPGRDEAHLQMDSIRGIDLEIEFNRILLRTHVFQAFSKLPENLHRQHLEAESVYGHDTKLGYRLTPTITAYTNVEQFGPFKEVGLGMMITPVKTEKTLLELYYEREIISDFPAFIRAGQAMHGQTTRDWDFGGHFMQRLFKFGAFSFIADVDFGILGYDGVTPSMLRWRIAAGVATPWFQFTAPINNNCMNLGNNNGADPLAKSGEGKGGNKCNSFTEFKLFPIQIAKDVAGLYKQWFGGESK